MRVETFHYVQLCSFKYEKVSLEPVKLKKLSKIQRKFLNYINKNKDWFRLIVLAYLNKNI